MLKECLYLFISSGFRIAEEILVGIPVGVTLRDPKRCVIEVNVNIIPAVAQSDG
jgi:hypothetical protein